MYRLWTVEHIILTLNVSPGVANMFFGLGKIFGNDCACALGKNGMNVVSNMVVNKKKMVVE